jgi:hypothetical protein
MKMDAGEVNAAAQTVREKEQRSRLRFPAFDFLNAITGLQQTIAYLEKYCCSCHSFCVCCEL